MQDKRLARLKKRAKKHNLTIRADKGKYSLIHSEIKGALEGISSLDDVEGLLDWLDNKRSLCNPEFYAGRIQEFEFSIIPETKNDSVNADNVAISPFLVVAVDVAHLDFIGQKKTIDDKGSMGVEAFAFENYEQAETAIRLCQAAVERAIKNRQELPTNNADEHANTPAQA